MSNNKYLIVYNICEIGKINYEWYIKCIDNLLKINHKRYHIVISGCRVSTKTKQKLFDRYQGKVSFCYTENFLSVNITFNLAVRRCVRKFGTFTGYLYFDSGVNIENNYQFLNEIEERVYQGKYSMITIQTDTDTGHENWRLPRCFKDNDFIMPVGKCCNLHVSYFSDDLRVAFNNKIIPDIFNAYCTESVFSFLNASIKKQWVIVRDLILTHIKEQDGATMSYDHTGPRQAHWNNLYAMADMGEIINDPEAKKVGLGYEEIAGILMHDPQLYTPEGHCKNDSLRDYIKENLFLSTEQLNYNHILNNFIPIK